jgi:hypothetical protein
VDIYIVINVVINIWQYIIIIIIIIIPIKDTSYKTNKKNEHVKYAMKNLEHHQTCSQLQHQHKCIHTTH